jgi:hypothetical protein
MTQRVLKYIFLILNFQKDGYFCPEDVSTWEYWDGGNIVDQDATVRCSDCTIYPEKDECCNRCGTVMVENFDGQTERQGLFSPMSDGTTYNGVPVYEQIGGDQQMWFSNGWLIGGDYTINFYGISSSVRMTRFKIMAYNYLYLKGSKVLPRRCFNMGVLGWGKHC